MPEVYPVPYTTTEVPPGSELEGGITNSAPENTIPVVDDEGNLIDSGITWDSGGNSLNIARPAEGIVNIRGVGVGVQMFLLAADGDATRVGGEITIKAGQSAGADGGQLNLEAGDDTADGDGGNVVIRSGRGSTDGGNNGEIQIQPGGGHLGDGDGGNLTLSGGFANDGSGGNVVLQAGNSLNGSQGTIQAYSADSNNSLELSDSGLTVTGPVGFYGGSPAARPQVPASPTVQQVVNALVALGLITQAA